MDLKGRYTDAWGNVIFDADGLIDLLLRGCEFQNLVAKPDDRIHKFNDRCREFDHPEDQIQIYSEPAIPVEQYDFANQQDWFTPEPYASLDVYDWLMARCSSDVEVKRVDEEWILFKERDMENVLRFLIYLIDDFRKRKVVWGVGRGSSVSSFCLYLIGVHKINSIAFDLDVSEFLK